MYCETEIKAIVDGLITSSRLPLESKMSGYEVGSIPEEQTCCRLYRVYQKKGNPTLACHCVLITGYKNV